MNRDVSAVGPFGGPGGWDQGARIIGQSGILGIELDELAAATATKAGFERIVADVTAVEPTDFPAATGAILSSPCPTWSAGGLHAGDNDLQVVLDAITHAGFEGCDCPWPDIAEELEACSDPRSALAAQAIRWAFAMPNLEWLALEQVATPQVEYMFDDMAAELFAAEWESVNVFSVRAENLGMPVRRARMFLVARKYTPLGGRGVDNPSLVRWEGPSIGEALRWPEGHKIRTRGQRRPTGGNVFNANKTGWCLTEKARTWERDQDGLRLTAAEAGRLQGFPTQWPWQGARTRQFHQLADVVVPPVAAAVLGYVTNTPWTGPVRDYLDNLYGEPGQLMLDIVG